MVSKVDEFNVYVLSLDDDEMDTIVSALYEIGADALADEIDSMRSVDVKVNYDGPEWMRDGIDALIDEIYRQSKDGRRIIDPGSN